MESITYNYGKLNGRMIEQGYTQETLAKAVSMGCTSLNKSLNNKRRFKQDEMVEILAVLDVPISDVALYFFAH